MGDHRYLGFQTTAPTRGVVGDSHGRAIITVDDVDNAVLRGRRAAQALGQALRSVADDVDVTPQMARSAQAQINFLREVEQAHGLLTSAEAGQQMGSRSAALRNASTQAHKQGRLIAITRGQYLLFPGFQFDAHGIRPVMAEVIAAGRANGYDDMSLLVFLCSPSTYVEDDAAPVTLIDQPEALLDVTRRALGVRW